MRVLVLEDDAQVRTLVRTGLEPHGIEVTEAGTVADADRALAESAFDVIILDLTLPDGSGFDVLGRVNSEFPHSHVIVLSGAVTELDRIRGLDLGADDYVVKPFSARELTARVLAVRRRRAALPVTSIRFGPFELDLGGRRLLRDGIEVEMTPVEFALLAFLAARPGHVFSRSELLGIVWRSDPGQHASATVTEHVRRVRSKIEAEPRHPVLLQTVRGVGYSFHMPRGEDAGASGTVLHQRGRLTTVDSRIVDADPAAVSLLGAMAPSEILGAHVLDFVAPQSLRSARERIRQVAAGVEGRSQVLLVMHPDGAEVPLEITTNGADWQGGPAVELHLRHAADESPHFRQMMTGVLSDVTDAVVITDMTQHVRSWNGAAERLYGWSESEVLGRHLLDLVGSAGDRDEYAAAQAALEMADQWHGSLEHLTRDGTVVPVRASASVVRDEAGTPLGIVSVNRPVAVEPAVPTATGIDVAADLRRGLAAGEFEVYYQPVVSLGDGHVVTVEALLRWNHPEAGLLGPDAFIGIAEQSDVILELGAFVLATACRQVALWRISGAQIALAVNLSAREFADPLLVDHIADTVTASGLDLDLLWLEVTETALVEDVEQASEVLHELAALGIGISIDDFGTGWASLTYLRQFPVHVLKIDRSFVTGIDHDQNSATIVRSILALGAELDLIVVAEGIETRKEADALVALGCTIGQGYLFGRPVPAAEVDLSRMRPSPPVVPAVGLTTRPINGEETEGADGGSAGSVRTQARPFAVVAASATEPAADPEAELVASALRRLLRIRSSAGAAALLQRMVHDLGGGLVLATDAGEDAVPVDVSLGEGPALLPRAEPLSVARMQIERIIPRLAEDARQAIDLLRRQERLPTHADVDALTGLANRRVLARVLPRAQAGVIVMIDLDRLGSLNEALGHSAGDRVLADFGALLSQSIRAGDVCCRIGGEEFVIVATDPDLPGATGLVRRIRTAWAAAAPHPITFSAGAALVDETGAGTALLAADRALHRAKAMGRDRTELATAEP